MRHAVAVTILLVALALSSCAAPAVENERGDEGLYAANVREHVSAMEEGMERARMDLARKALRRMLQGPG